jgi:stage V sporulation protein G
MNITEVRVKLTSDEGERLRAFCSVTFDGEFVIRDIKVIEGTSGPFVAMPSRKLADKCRKCGCKNHLRAKFCNECGARLNEQRAGRDPEGRVKLHADVAHPIKPACREQMQNAVLEAYLAEAERAKQPGYRPALFDDATDAAQPPSADVAHPPSAVDSDVAQPPSADVAQPPSADVAQPPSAVDSEYDSLVAELRESATRRGRTAKGPAGPGKFGGGERDETPDSEAERAAADDAQSDQADVLTPVSAPAPARTPGGDDDGFGAGIV